MLVDARKIEQSTVSTHLCIIGAGAAGITIARQFNHSPVDVLLLESGGFEPDLATQDLYRGRAFGHFRSGEHIIGTAFPGGLTDRMDYPQASRSRYFGGSLNVWGGYCRPLDAIDFEAREWVPNSGWPISAASLAAFYSRAAAELHIAAFQEQELEREPEPRRELALPGSPPSFATKMFYFSPATPFGSWRRNELVRSPNIRIVLGGNCTELLVDETGRRLREIQVRCLDGRSFLVRAAVFILAAGGIETPRLLLASNRGCPRGVGNDRDLVGRYFMEHPHLPVGEYLLWADPLDLTLYTQLHNPVLGHATSGVLCSSADFQRERQTLNYSVELVLVPGTVAAMAAARAARTDAFSQSYIRAAHEFDAAFPQPGRDRVARAHGQLFARTEQAPDPESRVKLGTERDALGVPRIELHWRMGALDHRSIYESTLELGRVLCRCHRGRVRLRLQREQAEEVEFGAHHIGTTRMSDDPGRGVVDADCRVHGIDNLYVAGSSVFPTAGWANPTLTILALALRLADRLKARQPWTAGGG
jgi:choline dehydrogenase-like flavoprotein